MAKPNFTEAALANIAETGIDYTNDLHALRHGSDTPDALLDHCLNGADDDRRQGWIDYVNALVEASLT